VKYDTTVVPHLKTGIQAIAVMIWEFSKLVLNMTCTSFILLIEQWMLGILCKIGLLWLTVLTLLNAGLIYIGKTKRLSTFFCAQLQGTGSR